MDYDFYFKLPFLQLFAKYIYIFYISIYKMFSWLNHNKYIYCFSNLLVLPAIIIPQFDLLANAAFIVSFLFLIKKNLLLLLAVCSILVVKNNSNYRFNILLKHKGVEVSKSDYECVYLYAWCTLLRYFLIGIAGNQIFLFLNT